MKKNITLFLLGATPALFAAIDAGTYQNETLDALILNQTATDSTWTFDNVTFTNTGNMGLDNSSGASYNIELVNTSANLSQINFSRNLGDTTFSVQGSSENRAQVAITGGDWKTYINASKTEGSTNTSKLALGGYADFSANTFCMASDSGFVAGTSITDISGASNTFAISGNTFINNAAASEASKTVNFYFNISGAEGAKSTATFGNNFTVRAGGTGDVQVNMKGNAEMTIANEFNFARDANNGKATFTMSGQNNKLISTAAGHKFFIGANATGGVAEFVIDGKNNVLDVAGNAYLGTDQSGSAASIMKIRGTGHDINFNAGFTVREKGATDSATLIFAADADGTSTLNANSITFNSGDLVIDFTDFVGNESEIYEINLISADTDWSSRASRFVGNSENYEGDASVLTGDNCLSWEIKYEDNNLTFIYEYSYIPEPSTYAAIFGTLALALVIYRRRK